MHIMVMDAKHWYARATNARILADNVREWKMKRLLVQLAKTYTELAEHTRDLANKDGYAELTLAPAEINE